MPLLSKKSLAIKSPAPVPIAADALLISELRYRRLFETARDGVILLDSDSRKITDVNPFMCELLGYGREVFIGKELWEIGLLRDVAHSQKMFSALRKKQFVRYEDLPLKSAAGKICEVEVVANLYNEAARPVIQCNVRDITERKRVERELAAAKEEINRHVLELDKVVAERTAKLRETIGELEAFSYSVSHDMRAPLRAMRGFARLLLEEHASQLDATGTRCLEKIEISAGRMDKLIQEILAYTRVSSGKIKIEPVDLNLLVSHTIDTYPQLQAPGVNIHIDGVLPKVLGNEAGLAQCISNLLTNAVKFVIPKIEPQVKIWAEKTDGEVKICLQDNGFGIAAKDQERIFKMFERVNRDRDFEGTGMGLTIVRKAVERMGGKLGVESELGHGSKFWIQLREAT